MAVLPKIHSRSSALAEPNAACAFFRIADSGPAVAGKFEPQAMREAPNASTTAPKNEAGRLWVHQLQLTIADLVAEAHDVHHPIGSGLYYEDQKREAKRAAESFIAERIPKYLGYFETVLERGRGSYLTGARLSYADLSLFQIVEGLRYAFPHTMKRREKKIPCVMALRNRVAARPRLAAYLASDARIPFNESGIFRHYPELDRSN